MNSQNIYDQIIERAKSRNLEGYVEKHHIIPKCLGGLNNIENIVILTAREHFLCHLLLCEIYPENIKLLQALFLMSTNRNKKVDQRYKISSRLYENIKIKHSIILKNKKDSKETKEKRSINQKITWLNRKIKRGLIINEINILNFLELYPNIINLTDNNKHCINYCYNNEVDLNNIICNCNKGIKLFKNYTKGYKKFCSQKCANFYNKRKSLETKENNGLWNNSLKRQKLKAN